MTAPQLEALLALQDLDTAVDQHRYRRSHLPERAELTAIAKEAATLQATVREVTAACDEVGAHQAAVERELASTEDRAASVNRRLYGGEVSASRELQALAADVETLKARASLLEDQVLELMEEREPLELRLADLSAQLTGLEERRLAATVALAASEAAVDNELDLLDRQRADAVAAVTEELLATYDRLRPGLGGVAVARLVGSHCDGCHLTLPAMELDRIRHLPDGELAFCDQCGRILVRVSPPTA